MYENITVEDFGQICRICTLTGELNPLKQLDTIDLLKKITDLGYDTNDCLPGNICSVCTDEVKTIATFVDKCKKTDNHLKKALKKHEEGFKFEDSEDEPYGSDTDLPDAGIKSEREDVSDLSRVKHECLTCRKELGNDEIRDHYKANVQCVPTDYKCPICGKTFYPRTRLLFHIKTHKKVRCYRCPECKKTFTAIKAFKQHTLSHGIKPFVCNICSKGFLKKLSLEEHMNYHTGLTPYICSYCGEGFKRSAMHARHVYQYHSSVDQAELPKGKAAKKYVEKRVHLHLECGECGKIFSSRFGYTNHQLIHQGVRRFLCNICGKKFITNPALQIHMRVHTGETPFECPDCGKRFKQRSNLYKHSQLHKTLNRKSYHCQDCDKGYQNETAFNNHMVAHSSDQAMHCSQCDKKFYHEHTLHNHVIDHKSSLRKMCEFCNKYFARSHIKSHMRTHTGEKPYGCNVCGKRLAQSQTLKVHMRIHTGEVPYVCSVCGKGFHDSSNLRRHVKKQHKINGTGQVGVKNEINSDNT